MDDKEKERQQNARIELANRLSAQLSFALGAGLQSEAAIIARLIESLLTGRVLDLLLKITK